MKVTYSKHFLHLHLWKVIARVMDVFAVPSGVVLYG